MRKKWLSRSLLSALILSSPSAQDANAVIAAASPADLMKWVGRTTSDQ